MKVFISGHVLGSYRAQNIIKVLSDNHIPFLIMPLFFYVPNFSVKWIKIIVGLLFFLLFFPMRLFFIAISTHIVVLPMNASLIVLFEIVFARLLRKQVITDYYISFYDAFVNERKTVLPHSFIARINLLRDRILLSLATDVVFLNVAESEYYQKVSGLYLPDNKCNIIPLCIDYKKELFFKKNKGGIVGKGSLKVCWWGTYVPLHGLENIIKAFERLTNEDVELYIFGNSEENATPYKNLIKQLGLSNKVFVKNDLSFVNGKLAPFLLENCDLALGNFGSSDKAKTVLVNKLVDALSLGIPCLTIETLATKELLREGQGVIFCDLKSECIAKKILEILDNQYSLKDIGDKGSEVYLEKFSPDNFKLHFLQVLKKRHSHNAVSLRSISKNRSAAEGNQK